MALEPDILPADTEGMEPETDGFGPHATPTLQESDTEYKEPRWWFINLRCSEEDRKLIDRACAHPLGRFVKLVDNAWNITCNPALAERDPAKAKKLMRKYLPARDRLLAACGLDLESAQVVRMQEVLDRHLTRLQAGS